VGRAATVGAVAAFYRSGMSACEIAAAQGITRQGHKPRIWAGGLARGHQRWRPFVLAAACLFR